MSKLPDHVLINKIKNHDNNEKKTIKHCIFLNIDRSFFLIPKMYNMLTFSFDVFVLIECKKCNLLINVIYLFF